MKKKTTVLLALISMCLIATAGIGAVSASDEPVCLVTLGKISPDGNLTVAGIYESSEYTNVMVSQNEDGSMDITKNGIQVPERELCFGMGIDNCPYVYPGDEMPELTKLIEKNPELANVVGEGFLTVGTRKTPEKTDASIKTLFYKPASVSASDEPAVSATVGKINSDGTTTPIKTLEGSGPIYLTVTRNEDGSMNVTKNGIYLAVVNHRMSRHAFTDPDKVNRYPQAKVWYQRVTPLTGTAITKSGITDSGNMSNRLG